MAARAPAAGYIAGSTCLSTVCMAGAMHGVSCRHWFGNLSGGVLQMFAWEAAQDKTLIILMVCAVISLVAGLITDVSANRRTSSKGQWATERSFMKFQPPKSDLRLPRYLRLEASFLLAFAGILCSCLVCGTRPLLLKGFGVFLVACDIAD